MSGYLLTWNPMWKFQEAIFNVTLYYEKYGLSARARHTWRSACRSTDFGSTDSYRPAATACGSMVVRGKLPRASLSLETTAIDPLSG